MIQEDLLFKILKRHDIPVDLLNDHIELYGYSHVDDYPLYQVSEEVISSELLEEIIYRQKSVKLYIREYKIKELQNIELTDIEKVRNSFLSFIGENIDYIALPTTIDYFQSKFFDD
jgi:hypothetical protein